MAKDPDNLVLRMLRDIRATQEVHTKKLDDLYKLSTHTLGVAVNAHARYEDLSKRLTP